MERSRHRHETQIAETASAHARTSQCLSASSTCVRSFCSLMAMSAVRCFSNSSSVSAAMVCAVECGWGGGGCSEK